MTSKKALILSTAWPATTGVVLYVGYQAEALALKSVINTVAGEGIIADDAPVTIGTAKVGIVALMEPVLPGDEVSLAGSLFHKP